MKDSIRRFVLLKLTTDRYEASCGLFATAELLVKLAWNQLHGFQSKIRPSSAYLWCYYRFSRWRPLRHNYTSGFGLGAVLLFRISVSISKTKFRWYNISIHSWDITISAVEKQTSAISKFYFRIQFRPYHRNWHTILQSASRCQDSGEMLWCSLSQESGETLWCSLSQESGETLWCRTESYRTKERTCVHVPTSVFQMTSSELSSGPQTMTCTLSGLHAMCDTPRWWPSNDLRSRTWRASLTHRHRQFNSRFHLSSSSASDSQRSSIKLLETAAAVFRVGWMPLPLLY